MRFSAAYSGRTLITVDDNGPGVVASQQSEIFLPFFTTKVDGSGIGLSLARQIVLAHGGSIRVETAQSGGACFRAIV